MSNAITIPTIFDDVKKTLDNFSASNTYSDGRRNSSIDEDVAIDLLKKDFNIIIPPPRSWFDVAIVDGSETYYCNIKSSTFKAADNFSAKLAMLYCFTDIDIAEFNQYNPWSKFESCLVKYKDVDVNRNYYMIVINKNDGSCIIQSLKTLQKLQANGNNLPFQINWNDNKTCVLRTHKEARDFIIGTYKSSVKKKVEQHKNVDNI
jgi:hypothetical protein